MFFPFFFFLFSRLYQVRTPAGGSGPRGGKALPAPRGAPRSPPLPYAGGRQRGESLPRARSFRGAFVPARSGDRAFRGSSRVAPGLLQRARSRPGSPSSASRPGGFPRGSLAGFSVGGERHVCAGRSAKRFPRPLPPSGPPALPPAPLLPRRGQQWSHSLGFTHLLSVGVVAVPVAGFMPFHFHSP